MDLVPQTLTDTVYKVIKYGLIFVLSIGFLILAACSVLVHDTYWINKNPKIFASETLLMGLLSALPILYLSYVRDYPVVDSLPEFFFFFVKVALIHIGFQLSGVYSILFPRSKGDSPLDLVIIHQD